MHEHGFLTCFNNPFLNASDTYTHISTLWPLRFDLVCAYPSLQLKVGATDVGLSEMRYNKYILTLRSPACCIDLGADSRFRIVYLIHWMYQTLQKIQTNIITHMVRCKVVRNWLGIHQ